MRILIINYRDHYYIAVQGVKRKSRIFYYKQIGYKGVEFVIYRGDAYKVHSEIEAKVLSRYLMKRIKKVGFILKYK